MHHQCPTNDEGMTNLAERPFSSFVIWPFDISSSLVRHSTEFVISPMAAHLQHFPNIREFARCRYESAPHVRLRRRHQPARQRVQSVSPPARPKPGGLVPVGPG